MDTKKLREIAEWYDTTRTDAGYLFSGERGEASRAWHRAVTTQTILALLDDNDSLRAEVERLRDDNARLLVAKLPTSEDYDRIVKQLAAARAALKKAIGIAEQLVRHHGDYFNCRYRLSELRSIGKDGGNG